jgi:hypothetical protein
MNQFPPSPRVFHLDCFDFFRKFADTFAIVKVHHRYQRHRWQICHLYQRHRWQIFPPFSLALLIPVANLPPVSTIPAANLPPVSTTPAANLPPVSLTPLANNGNNIRLQTPSSELESKNLYICLLYYPKVSKQNY